jgi:hypothetical protein
MDGQEQLWEVHCLVGYHAELNSNNTEYQIWQQKSRPKIIIQSRFALQKLNYIHYNPVRAGNNWV